MVLQTSISLRSLKGYDNVGSTIRSLNITIINKSKISKNQQQQQKNFINDQSYFKDSMKRIIDQIPKRFYSSSSFNSSSSSSSSSSSESSSSQSRRPKVSLLTPNQINESFLSDKDKFSITRFIDSSFHLPNSKRSASSEYEDLPRIRSSIFFDHQSISDLTYRVRNIFDSSLEFELDHMLPRLKTFKSSMESLGISRHHNLICYDSIGTFSSPRAAWLLNAFDHPKVYVLDGGLPRWISEGYPVEKVKRTDLNNDKINIKSSRYEIDLKSFEGSDETYDRFVRSRSVISFDEVFKNSKDEIDENQRRILFDARSNGRFSGKEPEPRPMISSGNIPHSISLPFTSLLTPSKTFLPPKELERVLKDSLKNTNANDTGRDGEGLESAWDEIKNGKREVIVSCGSGLTACVVWLGIQICSHGKALVKVYDESWTGYALRTQRLKN